MRAILVIIYYLLPCQILCYSFQKKANFAAAVVKSKADDTIFGNEFLFPNKNNKSKNGGTKKQKSDNVLEWDKLSSIKEKNSLSEIIF